MKKEQMRSVNIELSGRSYPVLVADDAEYKDLLALSRHLNEEIEEMHRRYASKLNKQDILAMMLLTYSKKFKDLEKNAEIGSALNQKIDALYLLLENTPSS